MKKNYILISGLLGGFTALVIAILSELGSFLLNLPNIPFNIFDWMARHLPGGLVVFFVENMVATINRLKFSQTSTVAKQVEQITAVITFIGLGVVFGIILALLGRRKPEQLVRYGTVGGLILLILMFLVLASLGFPASGVMYSTIWLAVNLVGWGWFLGKLIQYTTVPVADGITDASRRQFLYLVGIGSFTILVSAAGVRIASANQAIPTTGTGASPGKSQGPEAMVNDTTTSGPAKSPPQSVLAARPPAAPGTRPELTSTDQFYRVDINTISPEVDGKTWHLTVDGLVNKNLQLTLDEIRSRPAVSQAITLECISNEIGGDLTSTALWTGVRLKDILAEAGLKPGAKEVAIQAVDGFYESVAMADVMDDRTLLVYEMNGQPLPAAHGYPLRIYIPNRYGMKQPKWITHLEAIDHEGAGYWVERGWSQAAIPQTTSVVDTIATDAYDAQSGEIPIGGIAYSGARGISKVEVQVDQGPWQPAELRTPPLSPLTWVEWQFSWKAQLGQHTFSVRAYDSNGKLQTTSTADVFPDGATGIDTKTALISQAKQ